MGPNRFQTWWYSEVLGWRCDAYPHPGLAKDRLQEVQDREHFTRGLVIDMEEHLTDQDEYPTREEFDRRHQRFTEEVTNV